MKSSLFESSRKPSLVEEGFSRISIQRFRSENTQREFDTLPKLKLIFKLESNDRSQLLEESERKKKRGTRGEVRFFFFFKKSIESSNNREPVNRFRKIRLPSWSVRNPSDQRDSCLKNAGRFIQSSRADNAHEAGDRSLSAYLMLVQQRRRVCVEAHIDCHPCRHPSPLLHHRCPPSSSTPPPLLYTSPPSPSCTLHRESYYVSPYIPLNRSPWRNEVWSAGIPATSYYYVSRRY